MKENIRLIDENNSIYSIPYELKKSKRRTYSIALTSEGTLILRVPLFVSNTHALDLLTEKSGWILKKYKEYEIREKQRVSSSLTTPQREALEKRYIQAAKEYFPERAAYYAGLIGVSYNNLTIRSQKTRWGSCSSRGSLSFNWKLMLAPPAVLDYVVVHELCHLLHMNHSREFWQCVGQFVPDYKEKRKWLRDNGNKLEVT